MLPLFLLNVGRFLKIHFPHWAPAYQLYRRKPSQKRLQALQNTTGWLAFWLTHPQLT